ncbi:MAG: hypothetical protein JW827_08295 [Spirochaetes bacterium]|nr:hypothetical protein [Spirochaetota bacterium]
MEIIPVFIGVGLALAVFLYFLARYHQLEDQKRLQNARFELHNEEDTGAPKRPDELRKRFCPICGSELNIHDTLYAEMYEGKLRPKVLIHGCRYCYIPKAKTNKKVDSQTNSIHV